MTALEAIDALLVGLLPDWVIQYGRWVDGEDKSIRYAVIKPAGGARAELVRYPQFTVFLVGGAEDSLPSIKAAADLIVEAMRGTSGGLVYLSSGEPAYMPTSDGRSIFELAVSAITT